MSYLALLASLFVVDMLAAMSPGPNFVLVAQTASRASLRPAAAVVAGFACANLAWCLAVVLGLTALFELAPSLHTAMRIAGGVYLVYLGVTLWRSKAAAEPPAVPAHTLREAFARGLLTNLTNPKSLAYFGSVFTLFMGPQVPAMVKALAIGIVLFDTVLWYGAVATMFSRDAVRRVYAAIERPVSRLAGAAMVVFGIRLADVRD